MALPPIIGKTLTRVGAPLVRVAKTIAQDAQRAGIPGKYRIINGFILRGVRLHNRYFGQVIDTPAMLMLAGTGQGLINELVAVGNRDDFVDPGTTSMYVAADVIGGTRRVSPTPPEPSDLQFSTWYLYAQMQPQLQGQLWYMGQSRFPLSANGTFYNLDTFGTLTYANDAAVGGCLTVVRDAMTVGSAYKPNYMALNSFWVEESQLPSGWSLLPRRLVNATSYAPSDDYRTQWWPKDLLSGVAVLPATTAVPSDTYCLAFAAVRQYRSTWSGGGYTYYDRNGLGALIVAKGSLARSVFDPNAPAVMRATLNSTTTILSASMPNAELRPTPPTYAGKSGGPTLDTPSQFLCPHVARYTGGFAKFFVHWAPYNLTSLGYCTSHALVVLNEANAITVLKADRSILSGTPSLPGATSDKMVIPWIVGAVSVERIVATAAQRTAYCLVWEQWLHRTTPQHAGGSTSTELWENSYELGGRWALYTVSTTGAITRTEVAYTCAPLFSVSMYMGSVPDNASTFPYGPAIRFPTSIQGNVSWYAPDTSYSSVYQIAPEKLVTACIPTGYFRTVMPLNAGTGQPLSGFSKVTPHNVSCAVFDLTTNTFEIRGVIAARSWTDQYCHITVVQPEVPAVGATPLIPATLLATMRVAIRDGGTLGQPADKTYLSIDGGWTWREYVTDAAGGNGSFLVGNQLWAIDASGRFDTNPFGS